MRFVLTAPLLGTSEIARHVADHGDGVKVIALSVPDAEHAYRYAVQHGARGVREPWEEPDDDGTVRMATIATYGETAAHLRRARRLRGRVPARLRRRRSRPRDAGLFAGIDHVVGNVELGRLDEWVGYYERVFGMTEMIHFTDERHRHRVLGADVEGDGRRQGPGQVPDQRARRGQAQVADRGVPRVLRRPRRPAHRARDHRHRRARCKELRERGVRFLATPESYYEELPGRIGEIDEDLADLRELGILADRDDEGYLLQIFTQTIGDRPTVFLEVIERHGARGFGEGNFKALFEAIEREQERRGNL